MLTNSYILWNTIITQLRVIFIWQRPRNVLSCLGFGAASEDYISLQYLQRYTNATIVHHVWNTNVSKFELMAVTVAHKKCILNAHKKNCRISENLFND